MHSGTGAIRPTTCRPATGTIPTAIFVRDPAGSPSMPAEPEQDPSQFLDDTAGLLAPFKDRFVSAYLVVAADTGLVRFFDGPVRAYLSPSAGPATLALFGLLRSDLHAPLRQALLQVADTRLSASRRIATNTDELTILVEPLPWRRLSRCGGRPRPISPARRVPSPSGRRGAGGRAAGRRDAAHRREPAA